MWLCLRRGQLRPVGVQGVQGLVEEMYGGVVEGSCCRDDLGTV